jgi:hypothetical protein
VVPAAGGSRRVAVPGGEPGGVLIGAPTPRVAGVRAARRPIQRADARRAESGDVAATRYTTTDAANVTYDVLLNDYPKAGIARANPHKLLDSVRDGLVYQTKGRVVSEKPITLANFPGRDQVIVGANGTHYRVRLVWAGTRLYQIMAVTPGEPRPESNIFFDSFRITGGP